MGFCCINSFLPFFRAGMKQSVSTGNIPLQEVKVIQSFFSKIEKKIKISFQEGMNLGSQPNLNNDGAFEVRNTRG